MPTRHRDVLSATASGQLTITKHPHGCLMIFPRNEWEKFRDAHRLAADAGTVVETHLSRQRHGRRRRTPPAACLVSPELRAAAGISKDTVLLGMGSYFELWDAATYAAQEAEQMKGEMPDVFRNFSF